MSRRQLLVVVVVVYVLATLLWVSIHANDDGNQQAISNDGGKGIDSFPRPLPCGIGHRPNQSTSAIARVVGGIEAQPGEYPWMVGVRDIINATHSVHGCGGVIIDERHILTAAHCISGKFNMGYRKEHILHIGDYDKDREDGEQMIGLEDVAFIDDVALVTTNETMKFRLTKNKLGSVNRICLPSRDETINFKWQFDLKVTVAGWGQIENRTLPAKLRKVGLSIIGCRNFTDFFADKTLCATADNGQDACLYDSGGPLFVESGGQFVLTALVSAGPWPCGDDSDLDATYSNVYHYLQWIESFLE